MEPYEPLSGKTSSMRTRECLIPQRFKGSDRSVKATTTVSANFLSGLCAGCLTNPGDPHQKRDF